MKTPADHELDALLRAAAGDDRPDAWSASVVRGLEARVLLRLARPISWGDALFSLNSWRPLAAAAVIALAAAVWSAPAVADVLNDDWLATHATVDESAEEIVTPDLGDSDVEF